MPPKYPIDQPNAETRPMFAGVETWCSIALYETDANSKKIEPRPISSRPSHR